MLQRGACPILNLIDHLFLNSQAPSVVFIDELDAVGRERGLIKGSGGQERDATLNQVYHGTKFPTAIMKVFCACLLVDVYYFLNAPATSLLGWV